MALSGCASNRPTVYFENAFPPIKLSAGEDLAIDPAFERALSAVIAASELLRVGVLAVTLAVLLVSDELLFLFARDLVEKFTQKPLPAWLPSRAARPVESTMSVNSTVARSRSAGTSLRVPVRNCSTSSTMRSARS